MENIRVRFAPSPTGYLHIGGARTALFNWLFARKMKGTFILRIEDTDEVRSTDESVNAIFCGMRWLGLSWDEGPQKFNQTLDPSPTEIHSSGTGEFGPYYQMKRLDLYKKYADQLVRENKAYYCYCSPEELEAMRTRATLEKRNPKYDGRCRELTEQKRKEHEAVGRKPVVRFKNPGMGVTQFDDIVRGHVSFENDQLDDFVIIKNSGVPTYQFAVVVDDYLMKITHVIRGDDHLSNTPKQILIYEALGWGDFVKNLKFAHLSMILGSDGARLSKRHGATSVEEYEQQGFLSEAMVNYLSLLGWSTEESQQLFENVEELMSKFSLERCGKSPGVFDPQKLKWMNGEYIRRMPYQQLTEKAMPFLKQAKLMDENISADQQKYLEACVQLEQNKFELLTELPHRIDFLIQDHFEMDSEALAKVLKTPNIAELVQGLKEKLMAQDPFTAQFLEQLFRDYAAEKQIKTSPLFHAARVATSGRMQGPSLFHYLEVLGKEKTLKRFELALEKIK